MQGLSLVFRAKIHYNRFEKRLSNKMKNASPKEGKYDIYSL